MFMRLAGLFCSARRMNAGCMPPRDERWAKVQKCPHSRVGGNLWLCFGAAVDSRLRGDDEQGMARWL